MTLEEAQKTVDTWITTTGVRYFSELTNMAILTEEVGEVALVPGQGGVFEIRADEQLLWSRAADGGFPEMKELKQRLRDAIAPDKNLGHSDRP